MHRSQHDDDGDDDATPGSTNPPPPRQIDGAPPPHYQGEGTRMVAQQPADNGRITTARSEELPFAPAR